MDSVGLNVDKYTANYKCFIIITHCSDLQKNLQRVAYLKKNKIHSEANIFEKDKAALIKRQTKVWGRGSRVYTEFGLLHE